MTSPARASWVRIRITSRSGQVTSRRPIRDAVLFGLALVVASMMFLCVPLTDDVILRVLFASLGAAIALFTLFGGVRARQSQNGRLTMARSGSLRFGPPYWVSAMLVLVCLLLLTTATFILLSWVVPGAEPFGLRSRRMNPFVAFLVLSVAGSCALTWAVIRLVRRPGIRVDEQGVAWRSIGPWHLTGWADFDSASVTQGTNHTPVVVLTDTAGRRRRISPVDIDSDPRVVVDVIEYFRTHPDQRHKTRDPLLALRTAVGIEA